MIDNSTLLTILIFVPIVIGFVGCIFPKSFYWIGFTTLSVYAIMSLIGYLTGFEYSYELVIKEGIPFSFDKYSLPLIFGSAIVIIITFLIEYYIIYLKNPNCSFQCRDRITAVLTPLMKITERR